ncbi:MAG: hypothetical protein AAF662_05470 [Pseudomonadota bacterium]
MANDASVRRVLTEGKTLGPHMKQRLLIISTIAFCAPTLAGEADVIDVNVTCNDRRECRFDVTVKHADAGWDHFANRWEVLLPDGEVLATRVLAHPHDHEQPFTRSLRGVSIPKGVTNVLIRVHDSVHKYGGAEKRVELPE